MTASVDSNNLSKIYFGLMFRKRTSVISPKLTRCRSTVDLRDKGMA